MKYNLKLRPIYYASVSGGKDSFFMLNLILNNLDKYPLDWVVHFELEYDWDWSKNVIDLIENRCKSAGIKFFRICPSVKWSELYDVYGFPNISARWCNNLYKLDCKKQLNDLIRSLDCRPVAYIGFCADEKKRFKYDVGDWSHSDCCYPLAEECIDESVVLEWAKCQSIFDNYYKYFKRQGCKVCPFLSMKELAYLYKYDIDTFNYMFHCIDETEKKVLNEKGKRWLFKNVGGEVIKNRVIDKWVPLLNYDESQLSIYDFLDNSIIE